MTSNMSPRVQIDNWRSHGAQSLLMLLGPQIFSSALQFNNSLQNHSLRSSCLQSYRFIFSPRCCHQSHLNVDIILMFHISFGDFSPAVYIRNYTQEVIEPYANASKIYDQELLRPLLVEVFKWMEFEVSQELMRVLAFGRDKYIRITLEEMTDYVMEKHLGENTLIRYAKKIGYARRDEQIMNKKEFIDTLAMGLDFLNRFTITQFRQEFESIFEQLDNRKVGTIAKADYCLFLKHYFGSESPMAINPTKRVTQISESRELITSPRREPQQSYQQRIREIANEGAALQDNNAFYLAKKETSPQSNSIRSLKLWSALDEFHDLIISSISQKCDEYDEDRDGFLFRSQIERMLYEVLELQLKSIDFIIQNHMIFNHQNTVAIPDFIEVVCQIHFRQILTTIIKNDFKMDSPNQIYLQKQYFAQKVLENCYFFESKPTVQLLSRVYEELLLKSGNTTTDKITLDDFRSFILVRCCNNKLIFRPQVKKSTHTLTNPPSSIMEAENSHFQEDQSENSSSFPNKKQLSSAKKSISKAQQLDSKEQSMEGEIGLSSNKRTKTNKLSQQSISINNQPLPAHYPLSSKEVSASKEQIVSLAKVAQQQPKSIKIMKEDHAIQSRHSISVEYVVEHQKSFKQVLWHEVQTIIAKYISSQQGKLNSQQCHSLINDEPIFSQDRQTFTNKISKLYLKQPHASAELIASYIIHQKGELALIQYSKNQIKGKSTLNSSEIAQILQNAYGKLMPHSNSKTFLDFSKLLFIQNGKELFQYKNYLELVARNLSVKNYF